MSKLRVSHVSKASSTSVVKRRSQQPIPNRRSKSQLDPDFEEVLEEAMQRDRTRGRPR